MDFTEIQAVVSDMDGVLWRQDELLPGMVELFDFLGDREIPIILATNNSRRSRADYLKKLAGFGISNLEPWQIMTSGIATADYLKLHYASGTRIHVVGGEGLRETLIDAGFVLVDTDVEVVVAGIDFDFTYEKARRATLLLRGGAAFVGTNPDLSFPSPDGLVPGAGSILAMIEAASDVKPTIIGKPRPAMFEVALNQLQIPARNTLMIGDRMGTDIEGAYAVGMKTALVLTGVTTLEELTTSEIQPDGVFADLPEMIEEWSKQA